MKTRFERIPLRLLGKPISPIRTSYTKAGYAQLTDSIGRLGILIPLLVAEKGEDGLHGITLGS